MKKLFGFFVLLLMISHPVAAQLDFGVKGGLNISRVHFSEAIVSSENLNGFYIGPTLEAMIPNVGFGMEVSLFYSKKGFETSNGKVKNDYLELPVNLKYKFGIPSLKTFIFGGPYTGVRMGGSNSIREQIKTKTFSAGLNFGVGVELIEHLQLSFNYSLGLTDNYSHRSVEVTGQDRGWSINATILF